MTYADYLRLDLINSAKMLLKYGAPKGAKPPTLVFKDPKGY